MKTMKEKLAEIVDYIVGIFSFKAFFITSIATTLMVLLKHPTTKRVTIVIIALLCGILSGFITSEIAEFVGLKGVSENTISALLGILMKDFIQNYVDRFINKYLKNEKSNTNTD